MLLCHLNDYVDAVDDVTSIFFFSFGVLSVGVRMFSGAKLDPV